MKDIEFDVSDEESCRSRIEFAPRTIDLKVGGASLHISHWEFVVRDSGRGIDSIDLDRIFETFVRVDEGETSRTFGQGLGLDLPITAGLVQALNGSIDLKSQLGHGTTVTIRFPYQPIDCMAQQQRRASMPSSSLLARWKLQPSSPMAEGLDNCSLG